MRPVVFIAGPLNSGSRSQVAAHILTAQAAVVLLVDLGCAPYCPHANLGHALGLVSEAAAQEVNQVFLEHAEAVFVLPGWGQSPGARHEVAYARANQKPVLSSPQEVSQWLQKRQSPSSVGGPVSN